ncbi:MAG: S1 RNA-binding domain-containing protein [Chloroflexi bacterium]|nr:S1 RNA-binding domain-containing protein [Chloroflexota bacterium]
MIKLTDLKSDQAVQGKVTSISVAGAFLEVGAEVQGFVHISRLSPRANRVEDALVVGQEVELWIANLDPAAKRLELTMVRPIRLKWGQIKPGLRTTGGVTRLEKFGAFVDIGAERDGLVHISEMSDGYVRDPAEVARVGDQVEVAVLEVDRGKRQIRLTMNIGPEEYVEEEEDEEELPTAMELALREAMEGSDAEAPSQKDLESRGRTREVQNDLLARTLSNRVQTSAKSDTNEG